MHILHNNNEALSCKTLGTLASYPAYMHIVQYDGVVQTFSGFLSSEHHFELFGVPAATYTARMIERLDTPLKYARGRAFVLGCRYF